MLRAGRAVALALLVGACSSTPLPGTQLGTYRIAAQSKGNSCGLGAPDPWTFDVQLSRSGSTLYWSWLDGRAPLSGTIDAHSHASLTNTQTGNLDGNEAGLGPCTLQRQDDIEIELPGAPAGSLTGTIGYAFSVPTGSDCSDQLAASGGPYEALPCAMSYSMSGSPQ
jgi:hypothetical protein